MPICSLHLISLSPSTSLQQFVTSVRQQPKQPLVISKVIRWIITPTRISADTLLHPSHDPSSTAQKPAWDILLIYEGANELPSELTKSARAEWRVRAGVPSALVRGFVEKNETLLRPNGKGVPPLDTRATNDPKIASSAQGLELNPELRKWANDFASSGLGKRAVSMLNLLAFKKGMKEEYLKYGKAFGERIGSRHGGNAKVVGTFVESSDGEKEWNEIALAHYPSIEHFVAMLGSKDYQDVNHKHRLPSLEDTFILCTSEVALLDEARAKL